jgi:hypothetical protein
VFLICRWRAGTPRLRGAGTMAPAPRLIRTWSDDVKASKVRGRMPAQYNDKLRLPQTLKSEWKTSKERECVLQMYVLGATECSMWKG